VSSPFLSIPESQWVASNAYAFAIRDGFPVSPGHTLVIPRRLVATWFEATAEEQRALFELVDVVRHGLELELQPHGYNIGINVGQAAGQTVFHLHVHVIPRFTGDMADPRGGVRHVIPGKGNYLTGQAKPLATGGAKDPFIHHLEPLFSQAMEVAVLAAFVQDSGLEVLRESVDAALTRGARVRILTGDYLAITQADALRRLLDWMDEDTALQREGRGRFEARVVEVEKQGVPSFHPKSWRFLGPGLAVAYVGSSNISRAALKTGIEWNLRVEKDRDPRAWQEVVEAFEGWWTRASPLDAEWVERYALRARKEGRALPPWDVEAEPTPPRHEPHALQRQALAALVHSRKEGRRRALVVLATGLGKTLLAALDVEAFEKELGRAPRVLFLAHRRELLVQAAETFRRQLPHVSFGWYVGRQSQLEGMAVFASVQKLSSRLGLQRLRKAEPFDYVVVDEVHHAHAPSYRALLECLSPSFLLGLTATPERADEGDVAGLFDDHLAWRSDLGEGIQAGLLAPFAYFGLKDDVRYENIPWRNRRFDPERLAQAVQTEARMQTLWRAWREHPASRSLVFCCSIAHAEYVRAWLTAQGVRAVAVYSAAGSADRVQALRQLSNGTLDAVCAVDLFNEGVDVPSIDRVVMLRPTESPVVFLQQLGRGLRKAAGKAQVTVIDFVGNHRVFLDRLRTLLSLGPRAVSLREFLVEDRVPELPPGCAVQVELEAKALLRDLLPGGDTVIQRIYRELRAARGRRPSVGELYRLDYSPETLRRSHGSWFNFVETEKDLSEEEVRALAKGRDWFVELERTNMQKSFKMVLLEALLEADALEKGMPLSELARRSLALLKRSPELLRDLDNVQALGTTGTPSDEKFLAYWKGNPIDAWTKEGLWFRREGDRLVPTLPIAPGASAAFKAMTRELVDYRLARYRRRPREQERTSFELKVISNGRHPIIMLEREKNPGLPPERTQAQVRLPDESLWTFKFVKVAVNVAHPFEEEENQLPRLLRQWFGDAAGQPSTAFRVRLTQGPEGWSMEPVQAEVIALTRPGTLVAFPSLRAAAGAVSHAVSLEEAPEAEHVRLPFQARGEGLFAVRAAGDSMDGGDRPIRNGDWLVMRSSRAVGAGPVEGKVALVQVEDSAGFAFQVKRLVRNDGHWLLRSDNPERPSVEAGTEVEPIALLVEVIPPERLGPVHGSRLTDEQLMEHFGLSSAPRTGRSGGHLFLCISKKGSFVAPDRLSLRVMDRRPAETAYVLAREKSQASWRYWGVARWRDDEDRWALAEPVDSSTWSALGPGT
jgi:superfamily II DNA or RNA helicase/diadenosine tetraphosphate (Ap4A) HIT family hydrolase/SOS-response transcriptional repressor LexA